MRIVRTLILILETEYRVMSQISFLKQASIFYLLILEGGESESK